MFSGFSKLDLLLVRVVWVTRGKEQAAPPPQLGKGKRKNNGFDFKRDKVKEAVHWWAGAGWKELI